MLGQINFDSKILGEILKYKIKKLVRRVSCPRGHQGLRARGRSRGQAPVHAGRRRQRGRRHEAKGREWRGETARGGPVWGSAKGPARGPREGTTRWAGDVAGEGVMWSTGEGLHRTGRRAVTADSGRRAGVGNTARPLWEYGAACSQRVYAGRVRAFSFNVFFEIIYRTNVSYLMTN